MTTQLRSLIAALIVLGCTVSSVRADDKEQIKDSLKSLAKALSDGDAATAKKYVADVQNSGRVVELFASVSKAAKDLQEAAVAKFGEEGKTILGGDIGTTAFTSNLDQAEIAIDGDTATVTPTGKTQHPTQMKKEDGVWKLDFSKMPNVAAVARPSSPLAKSIPVIQELTSEIKDGKYASAQDAKTAYYQKLVAAMNQSRTGGPRG